MKNRTVIFGDSYSTFEGFIPESYGTYYSSADKDKTGVTDVSQTWWHMLSREKNLDIVLNDSWSGSTIGHTCYNNADASKSSSFIYRLRKLISSGFFKENKIDTVFVFGGTNDDWANAPLGNEKYSDWEEKDLYSVLPAISYFLSLLKETVPNAEIYCLINTGLKPEISRAFENACEKYNITKITFEKIDKINKHPTVEGMLDIKNEVLKIMTR